MDNSLGIGDFKPEKIMVSILGEDNEREVAKNKDIYPPDGKSYMITDSWSVNINGDY